MRKLGAVKFGMVATAIAVGLTATAVPAQAAPADSPPAGVTVNASSGDVEPAYWSPWFDWGIWYGSHTDAYNRMIAWQGQYGNAYVEIIYRVVNRVQQYSFHWREWVDAPGGPRTDL
ncbi:hypothetical protein M1L60_41410 [Actinoplanes sp. TRM 88003]|uniref:Uncharacterized protein n=1 Tax=Paractinoplanes aksuensis TaxID=2939490 RepID=A0ABT1E1N3_9ACTN|nr:hypothetical protein [Actinoplanes aksuensis]MCO8277055.1 hypothetical protein [Actinoplanes aksuensis]